MSTPQMSLPVVGYAIVESDQFKWASGGKPVAKKWRAVVYESDAQATIDVLSTERDAALAETAEIRARWNDAENELSALASSPPAPVPDAMEVGEDTKRLDWLIKTETGHLLGETTDLLWSISMTPDEARAAIDAARAQQSKDKGK